MWFQPLKNIAIILDSIALKRYRSLVSYPFIQMLSILKQDWIAMCIGLLSISFEILGNYEWKA